MNIISRIACTQQIEVKCDVCGHVCKQRFHVPALGHYVVANSPHNWWNLGEMGNICSKHKRIRLIVDGKCIHDSGGDNE